MKYLIACLLFVSHTAIAEDVNFFHIIPGTCSLSNVNDGSYALATASVPGDTLTSSPMNGGSAGSIQVVQTLGGQFQIVISEVSSTIPTQSGIQKFLDPSIGGGGANTGAGAFSGTTTSTTRSKTLANAGTDTIFIDSLIVRSGAPLLIGSYSMTYSVSCNSF